MKSIVEQLSTYKSVHLNSANIKTHFVGIPLIIWSIAVIISMVSFDLNSDYFAITVNLLAIISFGILIYYCLLSFVLALMALLIFGPIIYSTFLISGLDYQWQIALTVFIVGWILQFIGHGYEKAKPAFVDDLNQLLIGPLFLLAEIYFKLNAETELEKNVTELAVEKRKQFEQSK